jgi:predicted permease
MGFPLGLLVFGQESLPLVTLSAIITVCFLFGVTLILLEIAVRKERQAQLGSSRVANKRSNSGKSEFVPMIRAVTLSIGKNPLFVAPVLGALFAISGIGMPKGLETFIDLLGGAASPCALVALGTFMADDRDADDRTSIGDIALLTVLKLVLTPFVAYVLTYHVFPMPKPMADLTILLCALPTGTGPFMLAEYYKRGAAITANTMLYSTLASVVTLSIILYLTGHTA